MSLNAERAPPNTSKSYSTIFPQRRGACILPDEVLTMIFRYVPLLGFDSEDIPLQLALVCSRWCKLIQRDPFFYSNLKFTAFKTLERLDRCLPRSGAWPLKVTINCTLNRPLGGISFSTVVGRLEPYSTRIRSLSLMFQTNDVVIHPKVLDFPKLESLHLAIAPPKSSPVIIDIRAPSLQALRLHGFRPRVWLEVLSNTIHRIDLQIGFRMSASVLRDILVHCPNIKSLSIIAPLLSEFRACDVESLTPLQLDYAHFLLIDETILAQILRLPPLALHTISHVCASFPASAHAEEVVSALLDGFGDVSSVRLEERSIELHNFRAFRRDLTSARHRPHEMWAFMDALRMYGAFETASALTLRPTSWGDLVRARTLGGDQLNITLLLEPGDFLSFRYQWGDLKCTRPVRLTLTCEDPSSQTTIHEEDIDFIFEQLGQKAADVVLDHVSMAPNKDEEFDRLMKAMGDRDVWA